MALREGFSASICEGFRKCGEITTALKVGKHIYAINCGLCSTIFIKLEAFTLHLEEDHEQELFGSINIFKEDDYEVLTEENEKFMADECLFEAKEEVSNHENHLAPEFPEDLSASTIDSKLGNVMKVENDIDYQDPLEEPSLNLLPEEMIVSAKLPIMFVEAANNGNTDADEDDNSEYVNENNDAEAKFDSSEEEISSDSDEQDGTDDPDEDVKELTLAIIAGYEKHRILWDASDPNLKNRKKRIEAHRAIANIINKEMNMNLKWNNISDRIKKLHYKFRSELLSQKLAKSRGEIFTPTWYHDKLSFLNTSIKYKPRNKGGAKALANEKPALPLPNMTDVQNIALIGIYKSFPCLWDVQHIGFRFKNQRQEATNEMLEEIKSKMHLSITDDELQKKVYRIRYACTQEKHRKIQCERTGEKFIPLCKFYEQIAFLEDNVGPFKCDICSEILNGADQYKIHKSKHDGSKPFTCPVCNRGFMMVGNCNVHVRRHTRDYPFECKVCKKRYATSTDVNVHMRCHTGEKPYCCEFCGQSFRTWTFFDTHMRRHQKRPTHKCTICSKAFYENNKLTEHMKAHLNVRDKVCNICGKAFTCSKYLRQHKEIHAEKKKYVCKICSKDFAQYAGLSGHMKSHGTTMSGASSAIMVEDKQ